MMLLILAINSVTPGNTFGDLGAVIQEYVEKNKMSVVRDFCGHGIGSEFHQAPNVLHYGIKNSGPKLESGMCFTIEPMVNIGRPETKILSDNWTAVTRDKSLSAQFEHTVFVKADGCDILTHSTIIHFFLKVLNCTTTMFKFFPRTTWTWAISSNFFFSKRCISEFGTIH